MVEPATYFMKEQVEAIKEYADRHGLHSIVAAERLWQSLSDGRRRGYMEIDRQRNNIILELMSTNTDDHAMEEEEGDTIIAAADGEAREEIVIGPGGGDAAAAAAKGRSGITTTTPRTGKPRAYDRPTTTRGPPIVNAFYEDDSFCWKSDVGLFNDDEKMAEKTDKTAPRVAGRTGTIVQQHTVESFPEKTKTSDPITTTKNKNKNKARPGAAVAVNHKTIVPHKRRPPHHKNLGLGLSATGHRLNAWNYFLRTTQLPSDEASAVWHKLSRAEKAKYGFRSTTRVVIKVEDDAASAAASAPAPASPADHPQSRGASRRRHDKKQLPKNMTAWNCFLSEMKRNQHQRLSPAEAAELWKTLTQEQKDAYYTNRYEFKTTPKIATAITEGKEYATKILIGWTRFLKEYKLQHGPNSGPAASAAWKKLTVDEKNAYYHGNQREKQESPRSPQKQPQTPLPLSSAAAPQQEPKQQRPLQYPMIINNPRRKQHRKETTDTTTTTTDTTTTTTGLLSAWNMFVKEHRIKFGRTKAGDASAAWRRLTVDEKDAYYTKQLQPQTTTTTTTTTTIGERVKVATAAPTTTIERATSVGGAVGHSMDAEDSNDINNDDPMEEEEEDTYSDNGNVPLFNNNVPVPLPFKHDLFEEEEEPSISVASIGAESPDEGSMVKLRRSIWCDSI